MSLDVCKPHDVGQGELRNMGSESVPFWLEQPTKHGDMEFAELKFLVRFPSVRTQ